MNMKEKLLFVWILAMVAFSFFFSHFWSFTVHALEQTVALHAISSPVVAKFAAGFSGVQLLS